MRRNIPAVLPEPIASNFLFQHKRLRDISIGLLLLITKRLGFEIKDSLKYHATIILRGCVKFQ